VEHASEVLIQHLNDLRMDVTDGSISEIPTSQDFVQSKLLSDQELRSIARAIYFLILGEAKKSYLDSLIYLGLGGEGNAIDRIADWILAEGKTYNYFPSELTLPLAQRLMKIIKRVGKSIECHYKALHKQFEEQSLGQKCGWGVKRQPKWGSI